MGFVEVYGKHQLLVMMVVVVMIGDGVKVEVINNKTT
jgi:hypothetical protein